MKARIKRHHQFLALFMTQHSHSCHWCPLGIGGQRVQQACSSYLVQEPPADTKSQSPISSHLYPEGSSVLRFRLSHLQEDSPMGAGSKPLHRLQPISPAGSAVLCGTPSRSHHTPAPRAGCRDRPFTSSAHIKGIIPIFNLYEIQALQAQNPSRTLQN